MFFALTPSLRLQALLAGLQQQLRAPARPVPPRNFHLTLAFLGERDVGQVNRAQQLAAGLTLPRIGLRLDQPGWFSRARVGWLGCRTVPAALSAFQAELTAGLREWGIGVDERPWRPHLTLYRNMRKPFGKISIEAIEWPVRSFALMRSEPVPGGVRYLPIDRWRASPSKHDAGDRHGDA